MVEPSLPIPLGAFNPISPVHNGIVMPIRPIETHRGGLKKSPTQRPGEYQVAPNGLNYVRLGV